MHLTIANKLYSSWSLRPWLLMRVLDIPFTETVVAMYLPDSRARLLAASPTGKVPVLDDGGVKVWESLAIVEYLADRFPAETVWPGDPIARAHARAISAEMHAGFTALRRTCPMNLAKGFAPQAIWDEDVMADVTRIEAIWAEARTRFGPGNSAGEAAGERAGPVSMALFPRRTPCTRLSSPGSTPTASRFHPRAALTWMRCFRTRHSRSGSAQRWPSPGNCRTTRTGTRPSSTTATGPHDRAIG